MQCNFFSVIFFMCPLTLRRIFSYDSSFYQPHTHNASHLMIFYLGCCCFLALVFPPFFFFFYLERDTLRFFNKNMILAFFSHLIVFICKVSFNNRFKFDATKKEWKAPFFVKRQKNSTSNQQIRNS